MDRLQLHNLPEELKKCNRWVHWALEDSVTGEGAQRKERKRCKIPKSPKTHRNASSTDAKTWASFEEAMARPLPAPGEAYKEEEGPNGMGLTFGAPYFGVDVDKCRNPETGEVEPWAKDLFAKIPPTYTELSPSQKGFHLWYRCAEWAKLPDGYRTEKVECYSRGRYFTMTGLQAGDNTITELPLDQAKAIFELVNSYKEKKPPQQSSTNFGSAKLDQLMSSVDFPDLSAAVQSLLVMLGIQSICDVNFMEQEFLKSKLYNDTHWKGKWDRLRASELEKAIGHAREHLAKRRETRSKAFEDKPEYDWKLDLGNFESVETEVLNWLWEGKIPLGNVTIFAGDPGQGKSLMALDLACRGSSCNPFLDGVNCNETFETLLLSDEDHRTAIIKPRLLVAGAVVSKIHYIAQVEGRDETGTVKETRQVDLQADLDRIRTLLANRPAIKLVVIDPLSNYMGEKSLFHDQEMRSVLMPINALAQDMGIAVICIMHNSKQTGRTALAKIGASLGGVGVVRIAWSFVQDGENRLMLLAKKNLGDFAGIEYTTEGVKLMIGDKETEQARMKFIKISKAKIENVLNSSEDQEERKDKPASSLLRKMIPAGGRCLAKLIYEEAEKLGINERTLRRAVSSLEIIGEGAKMKPESYYWRWPDSKPGSQKPEPQGSEFEF